MSSIELVADLPSHAGPAWCVAWNPTRSILASCASDKAVRLYTYQLSTPGSDETDSNTSTRAPEVTFRFLTEINTAHKRTIRSIAWSPNGKTLATASFDSTVGIWEEVDEYAGVEGVETFGTEDEPDVSGEKEWECITTLEGHESECKSVGWSADGMLLASCSRDKSVWVWELQPDGDFECISVMMEHSQDVKNLAWHPSEEILASASYDASVYLFADDPDSDWSPFQKLNPSLAVTATATTTDDMQVEPDEDDFEIPALVEPETVWAVAFSPCGGYLASGGDLGGVRIWTRNGEDIDSRWTETIHVQAHDKRACFSLSWTERESETEGSLGRLVSVGGDGRICAWDVAKNDQPESKSPNIKMEMIASKSQAHTIYDINSVATFKRGIPSDDPAVNAKDKYKGLRESMFATAGDDGTVKVWRVV